MILQMTFGRAEKTREGFVALHRVGDSWKPIEDVAYETADQAVWQCVEDLSGLLDGLVGLLLSMASSESIDGQLLWLAMLEGLEVASEALRRLWDEPGEEDWVQGLEGITLAPEDE